MEKRRFYVCDSYFTEAIADEIRKAFPDSIVFTDSTVVSRDFLNQEANVKLKATSEKIQKKDEITDKVDFFILSAKLIDDGSVIPDLLKIEYGNNSSKVIAISSSHYFLNEVKDDVDFTEDKDVFLGAETIKDFFVKANF